MTSHGALGNINRTLQNGHDCPIGGWRAKTVHKENDVSSKMAIFGAKKIQPHKNPPTTKKNNLLVGLLGKFFLVAVELSNLENV